MEYLGKAQNIVKCCKCEMCEKEFLLTPEDYIFNKFGRKVFSTDDYGKTCNEGWVCPKCADEIIKIKNL